MSRKNNTQVQGTNDACTLSKYSAVQKKYFEDDYVEEFIGKKKTRTSLIHLGYFSRAVVLNKLITQFVQCLKLRNIKKFQIISCGCGFDTLFWRLLQSNCLHESSCFVEIDFPDVITRKIDMINGSDKLKSYLSANTSKWSKGIHQLSELPKYFLLETSLCDIEVLEGNFAEIEIDYSLPSLFISECVITYMRKDDSDRLIKWISNKFSNGFFINYEQIHPEDGFGQVMMNHFDKLQSSLYSVSDYPTCESHYWRYKNQGFETVKVTSEMLALLDEDIKHQVSAAFDLELFDEFEEFHLKCVHYVVAMAANGILSDSLPWFNIESLPDQDKNVIFEEKNFEWTSYNSDIGLCRLSSCAINGCIYLIGGNNSERRSNSVYKLSPKNLCSYEIIEYQKETTVQLDIIHGSAIYFELDKVPYVCIYGGRTAPDKYCNNGSAVVFEISDGRLIQKLLTVKNNPIPRYRSQMVVLNPTGREARCYIFGGRTADVKTPLEDFWELSFSHNEHHQLTYKFKRQNENAESSPCGRMSHSMTVCSEQNALYLSGGFQPKNSVVFSDVWKWNSDTKLWICLTTNILPRYGHTSHFAEGKLYLVGGVNFSEGRQPGVGVFDVKTHICIEYSMKSLHEDTFLLFNHTSEIIKDETGHYILIIGGGGNCFSFGTFINRKILKLKIR